MIEIRIHGRGGQGAVIASKILAVSFYIEGFQVQSFPAFGVERRGAPICAFVRIDTVPINLRSEVYTPGHIIVLDHTLVEAVNVCEGLGEKGTILINAGEKRIAGMDFGRFRTGYVDATSIALKHGLGTATSPIINTAIAGAFASFTGMLKFDSIEEAIHQEVPFKQKENALAAREAFDTVALYSKG